MTLKVKLHAGKGAMDTIGKTRWPIIAEALASGRLAGLVLARTGDAPGCAIEGAPPLPSGAAAPMGRAGGRG